MKSLNGFIDLCAWLYLNFQIVPIQKGSSRQITMITNGEHKNSNEQNEYVLLDTDVTNLGRVTHISLASFLWDILGKQQNAVSHLGLFCLHREMSSKNEIKKK